MAGDVFMIPQQLNGTYYPEEDRLMLRIRTSDNAEYRLWLTRLITQKILAVIEKISIKNIEARNKDKALPRGIAETMDEMRQKNIENQTDLTQKYQSANKLPLGAEPALITNATFTIVKNASITMKCILKNKSPIEFTFNMATLAKVRVLLTRLCEKGRWDLTVPAEVPADKAPPPHAIH
jgi:hypothetical protein